MGDTYEFRLLAQLFLLSNVTLDKKYKNLWSNRWFAAVISINTENNGIAWSSLMAHPERVGIIHPNTPLYLLFSYRRLQVNVIFDVTPFWGSFEPE